MEASHRILAYKKKLGIVVVPGKLSNDIPKGTLSAIFKQAQIGD